MKSLPTISVVVATFNSAQTIKKCLKSLRDQHYPQKKINIIIVDGGSTDATTTIVKQFDVQFISVSSLKQNAEYNKSIGLLHASNDIVAFIDHDNILPHNNWFTAMVQPFLDIPDLVGVETLRYHYDPHTSLLDRYFALYGAGDPLVWYLGKADRLSYIYDTYRLKWEAIDRGNYITVRFNAQNMPTIGANGFLIRRNILQKHAKTKPGMYFDMDVNMDLILKGFNHYAFVKDTILHLTGYGSVWYFLKRRALFFSQYQRGAHLTKKTVRRYGIFSKKEILALGISIIICGTFIVPFIDACRGYRKIKDSAWFLHPFFCFAFVIIYSWVIIRHRVRHYVNAILVK